MIMFLYLVIANVPLTKEQVARIMAHATGHWDSRCRDATKVGGFLVSWFLECQYHTDNHQITEEQADIVVKILENDGYDLRDSWISIRDSIHMETVRINT